MTPTTLRLLFVYIVSTKSTLAYVSEWLYYWEGLGFGVRVRVRVRPRLRFKLRLGINLSLCLDSLFKPLPPI